MKLINIKRLFIIFLLTASHCYANEAVAFTVPENVARFLQTLDTSDISSDNYNVTILDNGIVELTYLGKKVSLYPFLVTNDINSEDIGSEFKSYDNDCISFGKNNIAEIYYCPIDLSVNAYPSFINATPETEENLTIPSSIPLPAGTILPDNVTYLNSISPYSLENLLKSNPDNIVEQTSEGVIIINDVTYLPFYGLVENPGKASSGASPYIDILENGTIAIPDGSLLIPFVTDPQTQQRVFYENAYPSYNPEDYGYTLFKGSYSEKFNLAKTRTETEESQAEGEESDEQQNYITIYPKKNSALDIDSHIYTQSPVFLNSTNNNDGTFTLSDGTMVYNPPVIDDTFTINTISGLPVMKIGAAVIFDIRGLPLNPFGGRAFIPGKKYINTDFVHFDTETEFPLDPFTLLPIDPYTGLNFISGKGFILNKLDTQAMCERKRNIAECIDGRILIIDEIDFDDFLF